ncbi:MAG: hypothetical protein ABL999_06730 [Pyrinomonadaceae bacterium]
MINGILRAFIASVFAFAMLILFAANVTFAQDDRVTIDKSKIPATAEKLAGFVPVGWKIEEQINGDVNGDGVSDTLLKLVEDKPKEDKEGIKIDRARALVIVLKAADGKLNSAAIADKLLQCTGCGGAFYGVVDAPADIKIQKGVIIVEQDHGSRDVSGVTFRFRFEAATGKFLLIGFDYHSVDRLSASTSSESTNYVTGARITEQISGNGKRPRKTKTQVPKTKTYIDQVDYEKFEEEASARVDG